MSMLKVLALPAGIIVLAVVYWLVSDETAGAVMLLIFGIAMGFFLWILAPTVNDVGPTAPVDPEWHERAD